MALINGLLIHGAEAALACWDALLWALSTFFGRLDALLNPMLSPALEGLNPLCNAAARVVLRPLNLGPPWLGLTAISVAAGVVMLFAFRHLSNQAAIGRAKDDIKANLLALKLFKDDLRVMFLCQWRLLKAILRFQRYVLTPVLWMTPPMLLLLAQMGVRYQWRPLRPGEQTLIKVSVDPSSGSASSIRLESDPGVAVEVGPVPGGGTIVWRIRGVAVGRHVLVFRAGDQTVTKELIVSETPDRVSAVRCAPRWTEQLLHPLEPRIPQGGGIQRIEIEYPTVKSPIFGGDYWILTFFVVSMVAALALAPVFRVRF